MRVVIDTSVWISGIFWSGLPHQILAWWRDGDLEVVISPALQAELRRTLDTLAARFPLPPGLPEMWVNLVMTATELVIPAEAVVACRDPKDNRVLEAAWAGQVDCIVSGDKDLTDLGEFCGIRILTPRQFAGLYRGSP